MKCPSCGKELEPSKKNPEYLLCYSCRKKYKVKSKAQPARSAQAAPAAKPVRPAKPSSYSNIPPKPVRAQGERRIKQDYDRMLEAEQPQKRRKKKAELEDYEKYDDGGSIVPLVILGILIVLVAAFIVYMYFFR